MSRVLNSEMSNGVYCTKLRRYQSCTRPPRHRRFNCTCVLDVYEDNDSRLSLSLFLHPGPNFLWRGNARAQKVSHLELQTQKSEANCNTSYAREVNSSPPG